MKFLNARHFQECCNFSPESQSVQCLFLECLTVLSTLVDASYSTLRPNWDLRAESARIWAETSWCLSELMMPLNLARATDPSANSLLWKSCLRADFETWPQQSMKRNYSCQICSDCKCKFNLLAVIHGNFVWMTLKWNESRHCKSSLWTFS